MKIFQFFINPDLKEDFVFDCFCFEPKNFYEKRLGGLYIVGCVKAASLRNLQLLTETARFLKERFYRKVALGQEKALKEALKEGNAFLEEKIKKENSNWLGGLSFAILNLKNFRINFTKVGKIKIQLIRGGKLYDLDKRIKMGGVEPYPFRVFGKIATGKLLKDDIILIENKELFDFLKKEKIFKELEKLFPFRERKFKEILEEKKEKLKEISGVCFVLCLSEEIKEKKEKIESKEKEFSFRKSLKPLLRKLEEIKKESQNQIRLMLWNKKWRLILTFVLFLLLGFFIFQIGERLMK